LTVGILSQIYANGSENILSDSNASPTIQSQQRELQKHMRADSLNEKLANRPKPEELVKEGILEGRQITTILVNTANSYVLADEMP
jgi:hypothetical protein